MGRFDNLKGFTLCLAVTMGSASTCSYIGKDALLLSPTSNSETTEDNGFGRIASAHAASATPPFRPTHSLQDLEAYEARQREMFQEYQAYLSRMRPVLFAQRCTPLPQPPECYEAGLGIPK